VPLTKRIVQPPDAIIARVTTSATRNNAHPVPSGVRVTTNMTDTALTKSRLAHYATPADASAATPPPPPPLPIPPTPTPRRLLT
jgi:hypothetical protein